MNYQRRRISLLAIHKQNNQLAIAFVSSMMRTGTLWVCIASNLQIEGWHNTKAGSGQFFFDPCLSLFAALIESQKG